MQPTIVVENGSTSTTCSTCYSVKDTDNSWVETDPSLENYMLHIQHNLSPIVEVIC